MSGQPFSTATKVLLEAAKTDGPSAAARAKVWTGVTSAIGGAAVGAGAVGGAGAASASASATAATASGFGAVKMLVVGTLLGGSITVGLAATMLHIGPSPANVRPEHVVPAFAAAAAADGPSAAMGFDHAGMNSSTTALARAQAQTAAIPLAGAEQQPPATATMSSHVVPIAATPGPKPPSRSHAIAAGTVAVGTADGSGDALAREASLIAAARAALARGDAQTALRTVRAARALPSPQLVPEELAVERQALRMLGSGDEARGVEQTLRTSYPDSALAR